VTGWQQALVAKGGLKKETKVITRLQGRFQEPKGGMAQKKSFGGEGW